MNKLKVALCMRGAIASKDLEFTRCGDLYKSKNYVDYKKCYRSIVKHILTPNLDNYEFDIFCQSWNPDLETELVDLYCPKKTLFEDNTHYNEQINTFCKSPTDFSGISQALSIKKVIELKEDYEKETNICYDIVILYRYDVLLWKDMNLKDYTNIDNTLYVNAHVGGNGDFHFIMNNKLSNSFKNLYDSLELKTKESDFVAVTILRAGNSFL
jgi:hypothetical protein